MSGNQLSVTVSFWLFKNLILEVKIELFELHIICLLSVSEIQWTS